MTMAAAAGSGRISPSGGPGRRKGHDEVGHVVEIPLVVSDSSPPSWNGDWRRPEVSGRRALGASTLHSIYCRENHRNDLRRCARESDKETSASYLESYLLQGKSYF
jgi:hypothetical protein